MADEVLEQFELAGCVLDGAPRTHRATGIEVRHAEHRHLLAGPGAVDGTGREPYHRIRPPHVHDLADLGADRERLPGMAGEPVEAPVDEDADGDERLADVTLDRGEARIARWSGSPQCAPASP